MNASEIRKGIVLNYNNAPHRVLEFQHRTPGNLRAFVQARLRNLLTGLATDVRFSSTESVERVSLEQHTMQYLYKEGDDYHFMNTETYDQIQLPRTMFEEFAGYLKDGMTLDVLMREGEIVTIDFPQMVELEIVETEDAAARGDTARAFQKRAKVETGAEVMVPGFIKLGDRVKIDTTTGKYVERV